MSFYWRKEFWYRKYRGDILLAFVVLGLPFCLFLHLFFEDDGNQYFSLFDRYYYHGFSTTRAFAWFVLSKLIPLLLVLIWFFTSTKWWRYYILAPIGLYVYSIVSFFLDRVFLSVDTLVETFSISILICLLVVLFDEFIVNKILVQGYMPSSYRTLKNRSLYKRVKNQLENIRNLKSSLNAIQYGSRLQHLDILLSDKVIQEFEIKSYLSKTNPNKTTGDFINVVLLMLIPIIHSTHHLIPSGLNEFEILGLKIGSNGFQDFNTFYWFAMSKFCVVVLMIAWFISTKIWWRFVVLSPVLLYLYQFIESLQDIRYLDSTTNINVFPAILTLLIILVLLSYNYKYKFRILEIYDEVENELEEFIDKIAAKEINDLHEFRSLSAESKKSRSTEQYLEKLYRLKQKILYELNTNT